MLGVSTEQLEFGTLAAQVLNLGKGARVDSEQYCAGDRLHVRGVKDMAKPRWFRGKESACQCRRHRLHPCVRRYHGKGNGNPLQYSCLENPMDRGACLALVHGVTK